MSDGPVCMGRFIGFATEINRLTRSSTGIWSYGFRDESRGLERQFKLQAVAGRALEKLQPQGSVKLRLTMLGDDGLRPALTCGFRRFATAIALL